MRFWVVFSSEVDNWRDHKICYLNSIDEYWWMASSRTSNLYFEYMHSPSDLIFIDELISRCYGQFRININHCLPNACFNWQKSWEWMWDILMAVVIWCYIWPWTIQVHMEKNRIHRNITRDLFMVNLSWSTLYILSLIQIYWSLHIRIFRLFNKHSNCKGLVKKIIMLVNTATNRSPIK